MMHLKNISVRLHDKVILNNLSTSIEYGDFVTIVGHNGAGKSTLFDTIAGKIMPTKGEIYLDGKNVTKLGENQRADLIGRLFQNPQLNTVASMTVEENLALALLKTNRAKLKKLKANIQHHEYEEILKPIRGSIDKLFATKMGDLSGGQRQMIALVMTMLCPPKILLLDEPTAALDPQSATSVLLTIARTIKQHKITTLLITHDQHIATTLGNKLWVLQDGTIKKELSLEKKLASIDTLMGAIDYKKLHEAA